MNKALKFFLIGFFSGIIFMILLLFVMALGVKPT